MKWVSFQSLIGGEMIGAEKAFGCPPVMTIDYDGVANSELYVNWQKSQGNDIPHIILDGGLTSMVDRIKTGKELFEKLNNNIDVVCAVPICSGLSQANSSCGTDNSRGSSAKQNNNMIGITRFTLDKIRPKVYLFENAPALFSKTGEGVRETLNKIADEFGYTVTYVKTNTKYFGFPQNRSRTFCIMWRGDSVGVLENPEYKEPRTILDVIKDTDGLNGSEILFKNFEENPYIKYCYAKYGKDKYREHASKHTCVLNLIRENNDWDFAKSINKDNKKFCDYLDYAKSKFDRGMNVMDGSPLVFTGNRICTIFGRTSNRLVHPVEERGFRLRELMRLMGMPDSFPIEEKNAAMIGQNVPVPTARYVCEQLLKFVNGKLPTEKVQVKYQNLKPEVDKKKDEASLFEFFNVK